MQYIHTATSKVVSIYQIRSENPRMSIPEGADLTDLGYAKVMPAQNIPTAGVNQRLVPLPPKKVNGVWYEDFELIDLPVEIPQQITRAQGKAALIMAGMWDGVLAYVATIADPTERALAEVALHDTLTWQRSSPFLTTAANALGMSNEQLDALFVTANGIQL